MSRTSTTTAISPINERRVIEVPESILTEIAPQIRDIGELQLILLVVRMATERGGIDQPVSRDELGRDAGVQRAFQLEGTMRDPGESVERSLELAVGRGVVIKLRVIDGDSERIWYFLNTIQNAAKVRAMANGSEVPPKTLWSAASAPRIEAERPTIFRLYEQNIGPLTPLIAQRLLDALEVYPAGWIEDAVAEAVSYNRRSWRYIARILENWQVERWQTTEDRERR